LSNEESSPHQQPDLGWDWDDSPKLLDAHDEKPKAGE
jgi:hypothetical protein